MDALYDELKSFFITAPRLNKDGYYLLESSPNGYCYYDESEWSVFLRGNAKKGYVEHFSKMKLEYDEIVSKNTTIEGLRLSCKVTGSMEFFLTIAKEFLSMPLERRREICADPSIWADQIKEIIGNKKYDKPTYQIIAEMILLKKLISMGCKVHWSGPDGGVVDIEVESPKRINFEVKSTKLRDLSIITLSEEYQPQKADYLCFYRFEKDPLGELSIDSVSKDLLDLGYDEYDLKTNLECLHLKNSSELSRKYHLLDESCYFIDDNFPKISDLYPNGIKPPHFGQIRYELILSGIPESKFPDFSSNEIGN